MSFDQPRKKMAVMELIDRKNSGCPLTLIHSRDEYRLLNQIRQGASTQMSIKGLFRWDASGDLTDSLNQNRPASSDLFAFLEVIAWFVSSPRDERMKPADIPGSGVTGEIYCPRSGVQLECNPMELGGAPMGSILVILDSLAKGGLIDTQRGGYTAEGTARVLKNCSNSLIMQQKSIFLVNHQDEIPPELEGFCPIISHEGPSPKWLESEINRACSIDVIGNQGEIPRIELDESCKALVSGELRGLTSTEVREALALATRSNAHLISSGVLEPSDRGFDLSTIRKFKTTALKRSPAMRLVPPLEGGTSMVGGLGPLKAKMETTAQMIAQSAELDGVPPPKGILMVGSGGTGKSLFAKTIGSILNRQIVSLDVSACKGSFVGQSESQFKKALEIADQMSPVILFLDEFEKVWGGGSEANDSGVSGGMLQTWLNWMQDWKDPGVYVIAACNDVRGLPGPVTRAGRFDSIVYVPLPGRKARKEILSIHLTRKGWSHCIEEVDLGAIADLTVGFSGSELEMVVIEAIKCKVMRAGVGREKHVSTSDLSISASHVTPTSRTHGAEIESLMTWARESGVVIASDEALDFSFSGGKLIPGVQSATSRQKRSKRQPEESGSNVGPVISVGSQTQADGENSDDLY